MSDAAAVNAVGLISVSSRPAWFSTDCLLAAEEAAERVLGFVRPTIGSEKRRQRVIDYVQRLLKNRLDCEVFSFGSVPLKTYLPNGDINLTAIKGPPDGNSLANDVYDVLNKEAGLTKSEFQVKNVKFIDANKVKLVTCRVQNFAVDINLNQFSGLRTLQFLEKVNQRVERTHLFKRSIILVKAWYLYESEIFRGQNTSLTTYALETLILYIIQMFHASLKGPLSVLYKFLDFYSQFDWETYCISLKGPVRIASLPNIKVESPKGGWKNLMLTEEVLGELLNIFPYLSRGPEEFKKGKFNIFDPLEENNNIGLNVSTCNFRLILIAFKNGAEKLAKILLQPKDKVGADVDKFFENTRDRGRQLREEPIKLVNNGENSLTLGASDLADLSADYTKNIDTLKHAMSLAFPIDPALPNASNSERNQRQTIPEAYAYLPCWVVLVPVYTAWPVFTSPYSGRILRQDSEGTRTNSPRGNDFNQDRLSQARGRNGAPGDNNRSIGCLQGDGRRRNNSERVEPQLGEVPPGRSRGTMNFERNSASGVPRGRSRGNNNFDGNGGTGRGGGNSGVRPALQSLVKSLNLNSDQVNKLLELPFGTVGDLSKQLLGATGVTKQESYAGGSTQRTSSMSMCWRRKEG